MSSNDRLTASPPTAWRAQKVALTRRWEQEDHRLKEALASRLRQASDRLLIAPGRLRSPSDCD